MKSKEQKNYLIIAITILIIILIFGFILLKYFLDRQDKLVNKKFEQNKELLLLENQNKIELEEKKTDQEKQQTDITNNKIQDCISEAKTKYNQMYDLASALLEKQKKENCPYKSLTLDECYSAKQEAFIEAMEKQQNIQNNSINDCYKLK